MKYAQIHSDFWTTQQARAIAKAGVYAQLLAAFLRTGPHASYSGLYRMPLGYAAGDLNAPVEALKEAMAALEKIGFAKYDYDSEYVFVVGATQDYLRETGAKTKKPGAGVDNKVKGVVNALAEVPDGLALKLEYVERYADLLLLGEEVVETVRAANGVASQAVAKPAPAPAAAPPAVPQILDFEPEQELETFSGDELDVLAVSVVSSMAKQPATEEDLVATNPALAEQFSKHWSMYLRERRPAPGLRDATKAASKELVNHYANIAGADAAIAEIKVAVSSTGPRGLGPDPNLYELRSKLVDALQQRATPEDLALADHYEDDI